MVTIQRPILINDKDWNSLPAGQRCSLIRRFIRDYNNAAKGNAGDINLELLAAQITHLEVQKAKICGELEQKRAVLDKARTAQEEVRIKKLEEEKQKIEDMKKCLQCKRILEEGHKVHNFPKGIVCNSCFMNSSKEQIGAWNG